MDKENKLQQNTCYEIPRNNRFLVKFPESFNILEWKVRTCTLPVEKHNGNIMVTTMCPILLNVNKQFDNDCIKHFNMSIDLLSQAGLVMSTYNLSDCKINKVNNSKLDYGDDDIIGSVIDISYRKCTPENNALLGIMVVNNQNLEDE